jgi:hypothetical protein
MELHEFQASLRPIGCMYPLEMSIFDTIHRVTVATLQAIEERASTTWLRRLDQQKLGTVSDMLAYFSKMYIRKT